VLVVVVMDAVVVVLLVLEDVVGIEDVHSLGSILPVLNVSTRRTNGRMERTL